MLRVSWSVLNHADGQPQHARRGEVMLDLGLEAAPDPELTSEEMQQVAFAAKTATLKALGRRPKPKKPTHSRRARKPPPLLGNEASTGITCQCGHAVEEHGNDPEFPGSSACGECAEGDCIAYEPSDG